MAQRWERFRVTGDELLKRVRELIQEGNAFLSDCTIEAEREGPARARTAPRRRRDDAASGRGRAG